MKNAVLAESIKLRTVVAHWVLAIIAMAFPIVVAVLVSALGADSFTSSIDVANLIVGTSVVSAMLLGAMSAISLTSDYGHNTIRPTYAATPNRIRVVFAKIAVNTTAVVVCMLVAVVVSWLAAWLILQARGISVSIGDDDVLTSLVGVVVLGVLVTLFGLALAMIIRNSPATVTLLLLWPLLIENLLGLVLSLIGWNTANKWMPYQAAIVAVGNDGEDFSDQLGRPWGFLYFAAVIAVLLVIGATLNDRRDA